MKQPCLLGLSYSFVPIIGIAVVVGLMALAILSSLTNPVVGVITALIFPFGTVTALRFRIKRNGQDISFSKARKQASANVRFDLYSILPESGTRIKEIEKN